MTQREVVVVSGVRTAIANFGGSLKDISPTELAGQVVAEAVKRSGISTEEIGHCVIGNVMPLRSSRYVYESCGSA